MEVEPSTCYSSRVTLPCADPAQWHLTSQPRLCSNHHSTWAHFKKYLRQKDLVGSYQQSWICFINNSLLHYCCSILAHSLPSKHSSSWMTKYSNKCTVKYIFIQIFVKCIPWVSMGLMQSKWSHCQAPRYDHWYILHPWETTLNILLLW